MVLLISRCSTTCGARAVRRRRHDARRRRPAAAADAPWSVPPAAARVARPVGGPGPANGHVGYLIWSLVPLTIAMRSRSTAAAPTASCRGSASSGGGRTRRTRCGTTPSSTRPCSRASLSAPDGAHRRPARRGVRPRDRPLARTACNGARVLMLLSFVLPEIVLGISLFLSSTTC